MCPNRTVVRAEALGWLAEHPAPEGASVVTSLPDVSELSGATLDAWRAWFSGAVKAILGWIPQRQVAVFYQSDIRFRGAYVDKGYLVMRAAEDIGAHVLWHKIVCRRPPGTIAMGRPSFSHMIALSRVPRPPSARPGPDVLPDAGEMTWSRAMGLTACEVACRFLATEISATTVVDPFCGQGAVLVVANRLGLDAIGVDLSAKRCRAARSLSLPSPD